MNKVVSHFNMLYDIKNLTVGFEELPDVPPVNYPADIEPTSPFPFAINVQRDQEMKVIFNWEQYKDWSNNDLSAMIEFYLEVLFEKMGSGNDREYNKTVPYAIGMGHVYNESITIPKKDLDPGVYKVIVLFKAGTPGGSPDDKYVAAFEEIGILNIYKAD